MFLETPRSPMMVMGAHAPPFSIPERLSEAPTPWHANGVASFGDLVPCLGVSKRHGPKGCPRP